MVQWTKQKNFIGKFPTTGSTLMVCWSFVAMLRIKELIKLDTPDALSNKCLNFIIINKSERKYNGKSIKDVASGAGVAAAPPPGISRGVKDQKLTRKRGNLKKKMTINEKKWLKIQNIDLKNDIKIHERALK